MVDRNVGSQYYFRLLQSQHKDVVVREMEQNTAEFQADKHEFIKNPVIAEFLGFPQKTMFSESELETSIINNLQRFIVSCR